jgi:hypothetical protein
MTAWDSYFSQEKPAWVLVTLKDGSFVYGLFGKKSFASDDPDCRDLYLEAAYDQLADGQWAPREDTGGVLIMAGEISTIEFRKI